MIRKIFILTILLFSANFIIAQTANSDIASSLDSIWKSDQEIRFELIKLQQQGKMNSEEFKNLVVKMKKQDSVNLRKITSMLDSNGWPDNLNLQANQTIFLVIQHAELETQKEYLPVIAKAVKENKTLPSNLALLKDRIALREGKEQIYGSQVFIDSKSGKKYVQPIKDPEHVDSLRAEVGLPTMDAYLNQSFQMEWSLEKYYEDLPTLKKLLEEKRK